MNNNYWLKNVRVETGFTRDDNLVIGTQTDLYNLLISEGKIKKIVNAKESILEDLPSQDAKGLLLLPSFIEKHVHLDKTYMGEKWRACLPARSVVERSTNESKILSSLSSTTKERSEALLQILLSNGSTHIRTHVDIYPEAKLHNLEGVQKALDTYSQKLSSEIVAFAQHGLLQPGTPQLLREAVRNGAGLVGAVDPATVDNNIEASLLELMDIAVEGNADIDLHLHDPGHLGTFTMKRLAYLTKQAGWEGRVAVSHAFGLADVSNEEVIEMAAILRDAGITIVTSIPNKRIMPIQLLDNCGVNVQVGNDNIFDSWWPTGNGDVLERVGRLIDHFRWSDEVSLSQTLKFITGGKTTLDKEGNQLWPKIGDEASMLLFDASCSAEVIARCPDRKAVFYKGNLVYGEISN